MIRHALILFAGLLAALTFACVAVAPPPVQRVKAVPQVCLDKGISDGRTFISTQQVQYLFGNPDPSAMYPGYGSGPRGYGPVGPPYDDDLLKAFDSAPPFFQADLCRLTKIFINLNDCSDTSCLNISWGYREQPRQFAALYNGPFARYIAISKGLWFGGGWTQSYHHYETAILRNLLGWNAPYYESAIPDDFNPVLLAALAHELGHVKWYETFVSSPGGPHNFRQFCDGNFFDAWRGGWSVVHVPPKWRELLTPAGRRRPNAVQDTHKDPPQTADIDRAIADNNFDGNSGAGALLDQIYKPDAPWANFFASTAPDEDFVETYKLKVLVNADNRLQSLLLVIPTNPSYRKNVGDKIDNGLAVKLQCFRT